MTGSSKYRVLYLVLLLYIASVQSAPRSSLNNKLARLPSLDKCGTSTIEPTETRIIGGYPAELGEHPWMAVVGYLKINGPTETDDEGNPVYGWKCGGSIITDRYVLTAAHCLHADVIKNNRPKVIRVGELDLDESVDDKATPRNYEIETYVYHPQYDRMRKLHDIGLIKTVKTIVFTTSGSGVYPICLPMKDFYTNDFSGYHPTVAGWGRTSTVPGERQETKLMNVKVQVKNTEECRQNYTSIPFFKNYVIDERVICASSPGQDSCQGDSGGPLILPYSTEVDGTWRMNKYVMGVVSYGYGCASSFAPGVYTRVARYMNWIINNLDI